MTAVWLKAISDAISGEAHRFYLDDPSASVDDLLVELPEPTGSWAEGPEWLQGSRLGDRSEWVVWAAAGGCVMLQRVEPGELTPEGSRELAAALLAAAKVAEEAKS